MKRTPEGFVVTYSRAKCAVFGLAALVFAAAMILVGLDVFIPVLEGTPLEGFDIERNPPEVWGAVATLGGFVGLFVAGWNGKNAFHPGAAMEMDHDGITARSLIGRRSLQWHDADRAEVINDTLFLYPKDEETGRTVPLQTFLTSVTTKELQRAIREKHSALFPRSAGDDL